VFFLLFCLGKGVQRMGAVYFWAGGARQAQVHCVANTAWAFATVKYLGGKSVAALDTAVERKLCDFNPQNLAISAWTFETVNYKDKIYLQQR